MQINHPNPYLSTRIPVFARNVVSTSHPLAAQAGLHMLRTGGKGGEGGTAGPARRMAGVKAAEHSLPGLAKTARRSLDADLAGGWLFSGLDQNFQIAGADHPA